jgi:hypothetical protein
MTPVCHPYELCSSEEIEGLVPRWEHVTKAEYGGMRVACYALPAGCKGKRSCTCVQSALAARVRCHRGDYLACRRGRDDAADTTSDLVFGCEGIE